MIDGVTEEEGIEISLCCNLAAFEWIIKHLEANPAKGSDNDSEMENELRGLHE